MIYNSKIGLVHFPNKFHNYTCHDQCKQACKMVFSLAKFFIFGRKCPNVAVRDNTCNHCQKWFKLGMEAYNGHELSPQKSLVDLRYVNKPWAFSEGARLARKGESGSTSMLTPHTNDSNFFSCPPMSKSSKHANMVLSFDNFSKY